MQVVARSVDVQQPATLHHARCLLVGLELTETRSGAPVADAVAAAGVARAAPGVAARAVGAAAPGVSHYTLHRSQAVQWHSLTMYEQLMTHDVR
jgi:hypothetical protein